MEQLKLLVVTSRFPYPLEKGDKLRVFHQIRLLSQEFRLVLVSLHEGPVSGEHLAVLRQYCDQIYLLPLRKWRIVGNLFRAFLGRESMQVGYFYSLNLQRKMQAIIAAEQPDRIYAQLIRTAKYVRNANQPKTLDYMDVFSGQMRRRSEYSNFLLRWFFKREARKMADLEAALFLNFNQTSIISEQDREQLTFQQKEKVVIIPNGIDTQFFRPQQGEKKYDVLFVGNMGYHPNVVAAKYLVREIMPLVWEQRPGVRVLLAGARPSIEVQRLAGINVTVSGWVEDIRDAYSSGRVFVAPLFLGSGQQNKILEAMAMGLPCITTSMVNNAIGGSVNENVLLAENATEFAHQLLLLLEDQKQQQRVGKAAAEYVIEKFSWEKSVSDLTNLIKKKAGEER